MKLTNGNLLGGAISMTTRLWDHIARFDSGAEYAIDDIAVSLRGLICPGNGGQVLLRIAKAYEVTQPVLSVTRALT